LPDSTSATFEAALHSAAEVLGSAVEEIDASVLWAAGSAGDDWWLTTTTEHVHRLGRDFAAANLDRMHPAARAFMEFGLGVSIDDYLAARRRRFEYVRALDLLLGDDAILLSPTVAADGFLADGRLSADDEPWSVPGHVYNTGLENMTGHPALTLPAGLSANGVPFGLQVVAPRFKDAWLLEIAATWERRRPWPRTAPAYDSFETGLGL
jgi:Asp-tRNA(Asn)/Glu-tRNA(Gln) amidotransferase A subunit family amidase